MKCLGEDKMKKHKLIFMFCVLILFSFLVFSSSLAQENLRAIIKKIEPTVVLIITYDNTGKPLGQGSGFFISDNGDVITNRHVLEGANRAELKIADGKVFNIKKILGEDEDSDLIRVSTDVPKKFVNTLSISGSLPETGEQVVVIGNPLGFERTVSDGIVSAIRESLLWGGRVVQITAPISPGSSGSPVVNLKGEVIGVATFTIERGQNLNFVIPGERVGKLKTGKEKSLISWEAQRAEEKLATSVELKNKGMNYFKSEDYDEAIVYFKRAIRKDPNNDEAYFRIGQIYGKLNRLEEAAKYFKRVIELKPNIAETYFILGSTYGKLKRYQEAMENFKEGIRIRPNDAMAHDLLGRSYIDLGRRHEALEAFKEAIRLKPDFVEAYINLSKTYVLLGRYEEAVEASKDAIRIKPGSAEAHRTLGVIYSRFGKNEEAMGAFREALRIQPDFVPVYVSRGVAFLKMGQYERAIEDFNKAIDLKPDFVSYNNRGYVYIELGNYQSAINDFQKSIELAKDYANPYVGLSIIYFRQKKINEARMHYKKAMEIESLWKEGASALERDKGFVFTSGQKQTISEILGLF